jgi:hexulose-6-phosphate isomerase
MELETKIGFMQGRLIKSIDNNIQCFPKNCWEDEFPIAEKLGFKKIEWIFDSLDNPILDNQQHMRINSLSRKYHLTINSICADFFMIHKLFSESPIEISKNLLVLENLIEKSSLLGIDIIEIPLVDSSSLNSESDIEEFSKNLEKIIPLIEKKKIILNLETDLPPQKMKNLIENMSSKNVRANYDIGNSTSLGYDMEEELSLLKNLISNVHIKDRKFGGMSVPLGTGDANLELFFNTLAKIGYEGDIIIQGARENEDYISPEDTSKRYFNLVKNYLNKYFK